MPQLSESELAALEQQGFIGPQGVARSGAAPAPPSGAVPSSATPSKPAAIRAEASAPPTSAGGAPVLVELAPAADAYEAAPVASAGAQPIGRGAGGGPTVELSERARTLMRFRTAWDMYQVLFTDLPEIYQWQFEELHRLSGIADPYDDEAEPLNPTHVAPMLYTLQAANGSGKDQIVLSIWAVWFMCHYPQSLCLGTSSSYTQLNEQTWRHIKVRAERINAVFGADTLEITKFKVRFDELRSEITLFRSDEAGKTEGWHPLASGAKFALLLNETKSIEPALITSFKRCHGYTHWINVSSPGDPIGYFYDRCTDPNNVEYPAPLVLGKWYHRLVDHTQCPHLAAEYERDVAEFGEDSPYIRSSYGALFTSQGLLVLVDPMLARYAYPPPRGMLPRRAGIDFALTQDSTVMSIWEDNFFVREIEWHISHEPKLTPLIVDALEQNRVPAANVYGDAGNFGTTIIQRMGELGYHINGVHNQGKARRPKVFRNRGTELAWNFRRLIIDKHLNLDRISNKLRRQMSERLYTVHNGNEFAMEPKVDFRGRRGYSPDHLDAAVLAHAGIDPSMFIPTVRPEAEPVTMAETLIHNWQKIYGRITTAGGDAAGKYRTSGFQPRKALQGVDRRFRTR